MTKHWTIPPEMDFPPGPLPSTGEMDRAQFLADIYPDVPDQSEYIRNYSLSSHEMLQTDMVRYFRYTPNPRFKEFFDWYYLFMSDMVENVPRFENPASQPRLTTQDYDTLMLRSPFPIPYQFRFIYAVIKLHDPIARLIKEKQQKLAKLKHQNKP